MSENENLTQPETFTVPTTTVVGEPALPALSNFSQFVAYFFEGREAVRTALREGKPWFVVKDICKALGMNATKVSQVTASLDFEEKGSAEIPTPGGNQQVAVVSETGAIDLVLMSRKPKARALRRWLRQEVIPAIVSTGEYRIPSPVEARPAPLPAGQDPDPQVTQPEILAMIASALHRVVSLVEQEMEAYKALTAQVRGQEEQVRALDEHVRHFQKWAREDVTPNDLHREASIKILGELVVDINKRLRQTDFALIRNGIKKS